MPAMTGEKICLEILKYIEESRIPFADWYVGITDDYGRRLKEHNVSIGPFCVVFQAFNADDARWAEEFIVSNWKTQGDTGGGDNHTVYVYAYRITNGTKQ